MTYRGVFIDDDSSDLELYTRSLNRACKGSEAFIEFEGLLLGECGASIVNPVKAMEPDIIILDYRFEKNKSENPIRRGGGLAQILRDEMLDGQLNECPIVLLSTENNITHLFKPDKTSHDLFDDWFIKPNLGSDKYAEIVGNKLLALCEGYKQISSLTKGDIDFLNLLDVDEEEWEILNAPTLEREIHRNKNPHVLSQLLLTAF